MEKFYHHSYSKKEELLNIPINSSGSFIIDMLGFKYLGMQIVTNNGVSPIDLITVTTEATWQDDGTNAENCEYEPTTNLWFKVASLVNDNGVFDADAVTTCRYAKVNYAVTGAGGDRNLTLFYRKIR